MTLTKAQIVDLIHEKLPFPKNKSTEVANVRIIINRGSTSVHAYLACFERAEAFFLPCQRVEKTNVTCTTAHDSFLSERVS